MELTTYVRRPFTVDAVEITKENIAEIAPFVGALKEKPDGTPFIQVDKRLVPNVFRVYPGFFMTQLADHIRCYTPKAFADQFITCDDDIMSWVSYLDSEADARVSALTVQNNVIVIDVNENLKEV